MASQMSDALATERAALKDTGGITDGSVAVGVKPSTPRKPADVRPERVRSLTSVMSTTGDRRKGLPKLRAWSVLMRRAPTTRDAYVESFVRVFRLVGSPGFPVDEPRLRELAGVTFDRGHHPAGTGRQLAAIMASGDRTARLRELRLPATVIHGTDDPLVPFRGGVATARAIPACSASGTPGLSAFTGGLFDVTIRTSPWRLVEIGLVVGLSMTSVMSWSVRSFGD